MLGHKTPGHGEARVEINFWFYLFVYYGFYNITALMWITKVFNIYSMNWWPESLGFPFTVSVIAAISVLAPISIYLIPETRWLTNLNTSWICWTFFTMAMPLLIAFAILLNHERHLGLRNSLSETQRIFTSSWWTGDSDTLAARDRQRRQRRLALRKRWLPASFVRFVWFCMALFIGMGAYFMVTYQTYVRALYARLRSPKQFIYLQAISSSFLILLAPLTISKPFHYLLTLVSINNQTLPSYQKFCARNIFIRGLAENVSMMAFLGSVVVLHYGGNKDVYPYFAFDQARNGTSPSDLFRQSDYLLKLSFLKPYGNDDTGGGFPLDGGESYDFGLTFYASIVTWACEIFAGWIVRRILWFGWKVDVTGEGKNDLGMWPELLPTGVVVMVHVLQNMLFSIVRLRFH
ncbi:hypothetical protein D0Z07_0800 [Hyphodiscus hymeniophilus]|uniref:Uncharacterized protein n=1 Tax=Hyphodiscus hymeniophilus TaxID=353542 RepID=A0A9P6VQM8_9HELO|nr:hypothetical protein D0Z07_0800 [Hyphodiscus hymeniophilus]